MERTWIVFVVTAVLGMSEATGQQVERQLDQLRGEIAILRASLDSMKAAQSETESGAYEEVEERLEERIGGLESKIDAVARSTATTVFNPRITGFINVAARADSRTMFDLADPSREIGDRPFLSTFELDIRSAVDPYAEAVTVIAMENEAGSEFAVDVEEAYGLVKRLPILESAPLGVKLKIGKYRAPIGVNNRIHMHDLPWTTRPLVISKFLGTEHGEFFEGGFNPTGIDLDFFLPNPIPSTTFEMNLDVVRAGETGLSEGRTGGQPAYIGHVTLSKDWDNEHFLVLGASAYEEGGENRTRLWSADLTYKWASAERRHSNSLVAGGELFAARQSYLDTALARIENRPHGWFAYTQYQFSYWTYAGVRYEWLREPADDQLITRSWSAFLSYYTTEFLRFRLGFQRIESDAFPPDLNGNNSIMLDINFVFGSHPTEPYWVNR